MATGKKSFILYCDQRGTWERLSDEQAGKLIKHVFSYVNDENPESDFITELAFEGIKRALKSDLKKYEAIKEKRSEAGRKGGKQTQAKQANAYSAKANQAVNDNVSVNDNVTVNVSTNVDNTRVKLSDRIPSIESFINYGLEKAAANKLNVSERSLKMKYEAWKENGWINGNGQEIRNWKSSLLNTLKHIQETEKGKPKEFETQEEREAREILETIKADNLRRTLYGPDADEFEPQLKKLK